MATVLLGASSATCRDPVILPYFHSGMARVMPFKHTLPGVGHSVEVAVGQPVDLAHITCRCNQQGGSAKLLSSARYVCAPLAMSGWCLALQLACAPVESVQYVSLAAGSIAMYECMQGDCLLLWVSVAMPG